MAAGYEDIDRGVEGKSSKSVTFRYEQVAYEIRIDKGYERNWLRSVLS